MCLKFLLPACALALGLLACKETPTGVLGVGPSGGTLSFLDGAVEVVVPAGALDSTVNLSVRRVSGYPRVYTLVPETVIEITPAGVFFAKPLEVRIIYPELLVPSNIGVSEDELGVYRIVENAWSRVSGEVLDVGGNTLRFAVVSLGTFAVLGHPVASVALNSAAIVVDSGGSSALTAVVRSAAGVVLPRRLIAWSSSNPAVASVSDSGRLSALRPGVVSITATAEDKADTVTVSVNSLAPPAPPGPFNEPGGYEAIVNRQFNTRATSDADRGTGTFPNKVGGSEGFDGIEFLGTSLSIQQDATAPLSPPNVMRAAYPAQSVAAGQTYSPQTFQTQGFTGNAHGQKRYRGLYLRTAFKVSANWQNHPNGGSPKLVFLRTNGSPRAEPIPVLWYNNSRFELKVNLQGSVLDPRTNTQGLAANTATAAGTDINDIKRGTWYVLELELILDTFGQNNGVLRIWLNGVKTHEYSDVRYLPNSTQLYWEVGHWASTWGGQGGTIQQDMFLFWDHAYFSGRP